MELDLPPKLRRALEREAADARRPLHAHLVKKLEAITPPIDTMKPEALADGLPKLVAFIDQLPGTRVIGSGTTPDAWWWVKLDIDITHPLAWSVVQELGFVLNYLSVEERLPTVFMPVSPPPYLNGGPRQFLSWVIEPKFNYIDPAWIADTLAGRLPDPVTDPAQWRHDDDDDGMPPDPDPNPTVTPLG